MRIVHPERPKPLVLLVLLVAGADLARGPAVTAVGRGRHDQRLGFAGHATEGRGADIDAAEERARRGVVGPHLFLVGEQGRVLLADDHWRLPVRLVRHRRRSQPSGGRPVDSRHGDRLEAVEPLLAGEVRGQVGVIQPRPVRPREAAVGVHGTEGNGRVSVGHEPSLEVTGQRADRSDDRLAGRVAIADCARAVPGAPARVRRLRPSSCRYRTRSTRPSHRRRP